jgi:hypothetical protein
VIDVVLSDDGAPRWRSALGAVGLGVALVVVAALTFAAVLSQVITARRNRSRRRRALGRTRHPSGGRLHGAPPVDA